MGQITQNTTPQKQLDIRKLETSHDRKQFQSGTPALDQYLKQIARQDVKRGLAVVYVVVPPNEPQKILGFCALSNDSVEFKSLPETLRKKLPPNRMVPVTLLGQFAINKSAQGKGLGRTLLSETIKIATKASQDIGSYALVADAIDQEVEKFYLRMGFAKLKDYKRRLFFQLK